MAYENISGLNNLLEYGYVQVGNCTIKEDGLYEVHLAFMENEEMRDEKKVEFRPDELNGVKIVFKANRKKLICE